MDPSSPALKRSEDWWQIYQPPYEERFHSTTFVTERTIDFIEQAEQDNKPWLAWCSFPDPHHPITPPGDWFHRHSPEDVELPSTRNDPLDVAPEHLQNFRKIHPRDQRNWVSPCGFRDDGLLAEAIAATYGAIEMVDDGVGKIMRRLTELGVRDETLVVFTSDHGDMMGDHGLMLKGFMHYRGSLQVPLIIDAPGKPAARTSSLASSIDLGPTLLDLAGIAAYDGIQGQSLSPVLVDPGASVRDSVLVEDDIAPIVSTLTPIPAKTRTVITKTHRYTRNSKGEDQLFDLRGDPDELTDLSGGLSADRSTRYQMIEQLADAMINADDAYRGAPSEQ